MAKSEDEPLKRLGLMALGLVAIKAEEITDALVKEGKMSEVEGKKLAKKLEHKLNRMSKENEENVRKVVKEFLAENRAATAKELKALDLRLRKLEKKISRK